MTSNEGATLGSTWFGRLLRGDDRIKLTDTTLLRADNFWAEISEASRLVEQPERHALVFLHGYCVKFADAARRTAQLKADLGFGGPAAFFSWPSLGSIFAYPADEAAIEASEAAIRQFLVDFASKSDASTVHVIAHSMGNRGLLRAMDAIARSAAAASKVRFGQIILAAPDVDRDVFRSLASAYVALSARSTLYVSENDRAIGISARLHRFSRAGIAPPVTIVPGIDTINVSKINLGLLGHSYVGEIRTVLNDIYYLLSSNTPPGKRHGLLETGESSNRHWIFAA
jgi:esterase/lipase superfamily enzyme